MNFNEFKEMVRYEIERRLNMNCDVQITNVKKNNGMIFTGITIRADENNIAPVIYINQYYEEYMNKRMDIPQIVEQILKIYISNVQQNIDTGFIMDFEKIRDRIIFELVNYDLNESEFLDTPYIEFLDMAIIFKIDLTRSLGLPVDTATIKVSNNLMNIWNVDEHTLYDIARINTPRIREGDIVDMRTIINELVSEQKPVCGEMLELEDINFIPMYVISNKTRSHGAGAILYPGLLAKYANLLETDFYILPSSVHECILLPETYENPDVLRDLVKSINYTEVSPVDILSCSVYKYIRDTDEIILIE